MGGSVMERFVGRFKQLAWFLPGFLLWAAFPPMGERMDVLFALAPLMVVARKGDSRKSARLRKFLCVFNNADSADCDFFRNTGGNNLCTK